MHITRFESPEGLLARAGSFLLRQEALHCLLLDPTSWFPRDGTGMASPYMVAVEDHGEIVAAAACASPFGMIMSDVNPVDLDRDNGSTDAIVRSLVRDVIEHHVEPTTVLGPREPCMLLVQAWQDATGVAPGLTREHVVYQLDRGHLQAVSDVAGSTAPATAAWRDRLASWLVAFAIEVHGEGGPGTSIVEATTRVDTAMAGHGRTITAWSINGEPVSMATHGGLTPGGVRITTVYTPPEHRNRGYASALVAATCKALLDGGRKWCFLLADAANAVSNRVYRKVGFLPAGMLDKYRLAGPAVA